jgi:hypothetical protein
VELMGRYSNPDIVSRLRRVLSGQGRDRPSARTVRSVRQKQTRLTSDQVDQLVDRYQHGESVYVLALDLSVNRRTVSAHLARRGVSTRYQILGEDELAKAVELYAQGCSLARVGQQFGVSAGTVLNAFKRADVRTRPVGTNQWSPLNPALSW